MKKTHITIAAIAITLLSGCHQQSIKGSSINIKPVQEKPIDIDKEYSSAMGEKCVVTKNKELFCDSEQGWFKHDLLVTGK